MCERPVQDGVHIDIFTSGRKFGLPLDPNSNTYRKFDAAMEFDRGPHSIPDPSDDPSGVFGYDLGHQHDGHNGGLRRMLTLSKDQRKAPQVH